MNERIKEIAELADDFADEKTQMPGEYHPDWHDIRDEKFAELIVRECLEQVRDEVQYEYDWKLADAVTKRVMEHFGVEL